MSPFPNESGFYWHKNLNGYWEMVQVTFKFGMMYATSCESGRMFIQGEHGTFSERLKTPDEY